MLVRKVDKAKWLQNDIINGETVSADAYTNCMKTTGNTLSVWNINDEENIEEAVLAIISGPKQQFLEAIDIIILDQERLEQSDIKVVKSEGDTLVQDLKDLHKDICELNYWTLGMVAENIVDCFKANKVKRYTKNDLKKILTNAIARNRLNKSELHENIQSKI